MCGNLNTTGTFGDCIDCQRRHSLPEGQARAYALGVMQEFERLGRLDYLATEFAADPKLSFENIFAKRGNMFGVLECADATGETVFLRAFSSLTDGIRQIEGWVPPVLSVEMYEGVILPAQSEIKALTAEMARLEESGRGAGKIEVRRREISQVLWERMRSEYRFRNFRGDIRTLDEAALPDSSITGGMGECCAPKLLQHAAQTGLRPIGIAEFYWGGTTLNSQTSASAEARTHSTRAVRDRRRAAERRRVSGEFYPSCEARCQPILGFMLCGLDS